MDATTYGRHAVTPTPVTLDTFTGDAESVRVIVDPYDPTRLIILADTVTPEGYSVPVRIAVDRFDPHGQYALTVYDQPRERVSLHKVTPAETWLYGQGAPRYQARAFGDYVAARPWLSQVSYSTAKSKFDYDPAAVRHLDYHGRRVS